MTPYRILAGVITLLIAASLYQGRELRNQGRLLAQHTERAAKQEAEIARWHRQRDEAMAAKREIERQIQAAESRFAELTTSVDTAGLGDWLQRVERLRAWLQQHPERNIPEMQFLTSTDWLSVAFDASFANDTRIRRALQKLRRLAKAKPQIMENITAALSKYSREHDGHPAGTIADFRSYLSPALGDDILARYEIAAEVPGQNDRNGVIIGTSHFGGGGRLVLQEKNVADEDYDSRLLFFESSIGNVGVSRIAETVMQATSAYYQAHPAGKAPGPDDLAPYVSGPTDLQDLREYWEIKDGS